MHENHTDRTETIALEDIEIPPIVRATPEEIERRRALYERVMERRERIGPIGIPSDDLVHLARADADAADD